MPLAENYTDQYIEQTFYLWHKGGRKISQKFANSLPEDEKGRRPTFKAIEKWRDKFGWIDRADKLDAEISNALQERVIDERIQMYEKHVGLANALIAKGEAFLVSGTITEMKDALKAIELGIEIERVSVGQAEFGRKLLTATGDQLVKELNKLLAPKIESEFIVDGDVKED